MAQKTRRVSHGVAVSTLFSAIALLYGTAAYGSFYPGHIDPGGNGTNVPGFTGDAIFNIDAGCVASDGFHTPNISGGCGAASVYSATIDLYSVSPFDPPTPGTVLGQFTLGEGPGFWPVNGVLIVGGQLAGVDTDVMGPEVGTAVPGHNDWEGTLFWLEFVTSFGVDPARISAGEINNFGPFGNVTFGPACAEVNGAPVNCVVAQVPEPGTLGLILGALGGGWLARRRKEKAAAA